MNNLIELDNKLRTVCPYCGRYVRWNDLLFQTDQLITYASDTKLAGFHVNYYNQILEKEPVPHRLVNWHNYPQDQLVIKDSLVCGIRDYTGEEYTARACPWCHNLVDSSARDYQECAVFVQDELTDRVRNVLITKYGTEMNSNEIVAEMLDGLVYDNTKLYFCDFDESLSLPRKQRKLLLSQNCAKAMVFIQLEPADFTMESLDEMAQKYITRILKRHYGTDSMNHPTLVVFALDETADISTIKTVHEILYTHIATQFPTSKVILWEYGDAFLPEKWKEGMEWLKEA